MAYTKIEHHPGCRYRETCKCDCVALYEARIKELEQLNIALNQQVMRLGSCVGCGELDEQDGVMKGGEFRCVGCFKGGG